MKDRRNRVISVVKGLDQRLSGSCRLWERCVLFSRYSPFLSPEGNHVYNKLSIVRRLTYSLIALMLLFFTAPGYTMSFFAKKSLFSEVNGVVLSAGQPVTGAEVEHFYRWDGPDSSNRTTVQTDDEGRFSVDAVYDNAFMTYFLPTSPSIQQEIYIRYEGKEYEAYLLIKHNYEKNGELDGKPLSFICELNDESNRDSGFYGMQNKEHND